MKELGRIYLVQVTTGNGLGLVVLVYDMGWSSVVDGRSGVYNWVYVEYPLDEFDGLWFILLGYYYYKSNAWCFQIVLHSLLERAKNIFEVHGSISIYPESNDIHMPCPTSNIHLIMCRGYIRKGGDGPFSQTLNHATASSRRHSRSIYELSDP